MVAQSKAAPLVESFGVHNLPLGGENGYVGVRKCRKGFQGYTPKKRHTTAEKETAQEAAIALAQLKYDLENGLYTYVEPTKKRTPRAPRGSIISGTVSLVTAHPARIADSMSRLHDRSAGTLDSQEVATRREQRIGHGRVACAVFASLARRGRSLVSPVRPARALARVGSAPRSAARRDRTAHRTPPH